MLVTVGTLAAGGAPVAASDDRPAVQAAAERRLTAGDAVDGRLARGERHGWMVRLRAGEIVDIEAESAEIDLDVAIFNPAHARLGRTAHRQNGPRRLLAVARATGEYRIEVGTLETTDTAGTYRLRLVEVRTATSQDALRVAVAARLAEGEVLRDGTTVAATRAAIAKYTAAVTAARRAGETEWESLALVKLGDAAASLGLTAQARQHYRTALRRATAAGNPRAEARALNGISRTDLVLGDILTAGASATRALAASRTAADAGLEAEALNNLGDADAFVGKTQESLATYADAIAAAERAHDRRQLARALLNVGYSHADLRDGEAARTSYTRALALWKAAGDQSQEAVTMNAFGHLYSAIGQRQEALEAYRRARVVFERIGDAINLGVTFNGIGLVHLELGDRETALDYFGRQLRAQRAAGAKQGEAGALGRIGYCHYLLGQPEKALVYLQQSLAIVERIEDRREEPFTRGLVGLAYAALQRVPEALAAQERALEVSRAIGDRREEAYALNRIGRLLQQSGQSDAALERLELARRRSAEVQDPVGESLSLYNLSLVERERQHVDTALTMIQRSLDISESLRSNVASLDLRSSFFAEVRDRHDLLVSLLMQLHAERPTRGFEVRAFEAAEQARARSLLDGLADARLGMRVGVDPLLLEREAALGRTLDATAQRLVQLRASNASRREIEAVAGELNALSADRRELVARIRTESPRYASLVQPHPLTLTEVQAAVLDPDSVLLEYFLGNDQSYVWVVTPTRVIVRVLPAGAEIETAVRALRASLGDPVDAAAAARDVTRSQRSAQLAAQVSGMLLQPIAEELAARRLLIVADGILHFIPFAALVAPDASDPERAPVPLLANHEVVHLPSASTLALIRRDWKRDAQASKSVVVFADPVFEADDPRIPLSGRSAAARRRPSARAAATLPLQQALRDVGVGATGVPRLLGSRAEAKAIAAVAPQATLLLGFAASRAAAMRSDLGDYRVVHFATHGLVDSDHPELSGVVLSLVNEKGESQNGFLRLHDIYNLTLPVGLVVLSACSTAVGKEVQGEGLIGLVRGFMYAGSPRVLASLWKVDDEATSALMTRFYRALFEDGLSPAAALRRAQLELRGVARWRHPFYWAAFVLEGDGG